MSVELQLLDLAPSQPPQLQTDVFSEGVAPFCDGWTLRFSGDDVATAQTSIFHHLVPQELSQSLSRADGSGLLLSVVLQLSGHRTILRNQLKQLRIGHVGSLEARVNILTLPSPQLILCLNIRQTTIQASHNTSKPTMLKSCNTKMLFCITDSYLAVQDVQPVVGHFGHRGVHLLQSRPFKESLKHWRLENLNELELSSSLHFKTLQLSQRAVLVKHSVPEMNVETLNHHHNHGTLSKSDVWNLRLLYLFFSFFPSSLEAGRIMARYGPSTSKKMLFSARVT